MRKKWSRVKKIICFLATLLTVISIGYVWKGEKIINDYYSSSPEVSKDDLEHIPITNIQQSFKSRNTNLYSLEFLFFADKKATGNIEIKILKSSKILYQTIVEAGTTETGVWTKIFTNIELNKGQQYDLIVYAEDSTQVPEIYISHKNQAASESKELLVDEKNHNDSLYLKYGYIRETGTSDRIILSGFSILLLALFIIILKFMNRIIQLLIIIWTKIQANSSPNKIIFMVLEILICYFFIESSAISFQSITKIALLILSGWAGYRFLEVVKSNGIWNLNLKNIICSIFFSTYIAISFWGQRLLFFPINKQVTFMDCIYLCVASIWGMPIAFNLIVRYAQLDISSKKIMNKYKFIALLILFLILPACLALYGFNPGISSPDTMACLGGYAHSIRGMVNWHPPFYCLILKALILVWDSTYMIIIVQFVFWIYVMLEIFIFLYRRGVSQKILLVAAFFLGIMPSNYLNLCTIWKDIPYVLSLLWLTLIFAKFLSYKKNELKLYLYMECIVAFVLIFFMRQNGMVVFVIVLITSMIVFRKNRKYIITSLITVLVVFAIRVPLYNSINVQDAGGGKYIGLSQDILGVYYAGGELSEESMDMVRQLTSNNMGNHSFSPFWASSSYNLEIDTVSFISNYINTFANNPLLTMRTIMCRQNGIWDTFGDPLAELSCVNYTGTMDGINNIPAVNSPNIYFEWNAMYNKRTNNAMTYYLQKYQNTFVDNQLLCAVTWRAGIYVVLMIGVVFALIIKRIEKKYFLIFLPSVGQIVSLLLTTGWNDFRYYWPLQLMLIFIFLYCATLSVDKKIFRNVEEDNNN